MDNQAVLSLIDRALAAEQWQVAINLCRDALVSSPSWGQVYQKLGKAWEKLGELEYAIQAYTRCLQLQPHQRQICAELGYLYHQAKHFSQAIAHYQQALRLKSNWPEVHLNLAMVYHCLGDWESAIAQYKQVISLQPHAVKAHFNLAILYEKQGKLKKAETLHWQIIEQQPEHFKAFSHLGTVLLRQKRYDLALEIYHQALKLKPDSAQILNNIGEVYLDQENLEAAIPFYQQAIAIDPFLVSARRTLGRLWLNHQQYTKAKICFQILQNQSPHSIEANHDLGVMHIALGEWLEASACFRRVVQEQSHFVTLFCHRLQHTTPKDWYASAQLECGNFLRLLQDDVQACLYALALCYRYLGQALLQYGGLLQSERYFHQALQLQPNNLELYVLLGECLIQQERWETAVTTINMGLALQSNHAPLMAQFRRLQVQQKQQKQTLQPATNNSSRHSSLVVKNCSTTSAWIDSFSSLSMTGPKLTWVDQENTPGNPLSQTQTLMPSSNPKKSQCGGVTCSTCMTQLIDRFQPVALGKNVFHCSMTSDAFISPPDTFVVEIPHGQAWIAPQINDWMICKDIAILTQEQYLLSDLSRCYPWYLPGCPFSNEMQPRTFSSQGTEEVQVLNGRVAILSGLSGHVYYHWMIDVLPRIGVLARSGIVWEHIDWFVVNSVTKPFQNETLTTLGIPCEKIIESDRMPHIKASMLVVPSFPGHLDWVPQGTIDFLRQSFMTPSASDGYRRIYVSRAGAKYRQVVNESEIITLLEQYGFVSLSLETLSVAEQAAIFAEADVIVSPHGAALTNLVFCQPGTKVLELFAPNYLRTDYWMISHQLKLDHYYIKGSGFQGAFILKLMHQSALTEDMWIDPEALYLAMNAMEIERC